MARHNEKSHFQHHGLLFSAPGLPTVSDKHSQKLMHDIHFPTFMNWQPGDHRNLDDMDAIILWFTDRLSLSNADGLGMLGPISHGEAESDGGMEVEQRS